MIDDGTGAAFDAIASCHDDDGHGVTQVLQDDLTQGFGGDFHVPADPWAKPGRGARSDVGECDVVIVGASSAGLTAAAYAASEGLRTMVLEEAVSGLAHDGHQRVVQVADGREVPAKAVIVATGIAWRRLDVPGLETLIGLGVFYGAAGSEARATAGRDVFVVGAGNPAGQAALHLARHARTVTLLARGDDLARSMSSYLIREIRATGNLTVCLRTEVASGHGPEQLEALTLHDRREGRTRQVPAAALFVLIGGEPRTQWLAGAVQLSGGYVVTGRDVMPGRAGPARWPLQRSPLPLETSMPGVFAAGDARYGRVASAVGDGAAAMRLAQEYISAGPRGGSWELAPAPVTNTRHPQVALRYL